MVLQVRDAELEVLLWQRARDPFVGQLEPARRAPGSRQRRSRSRSGGTWPPRSTCARSPTSSSSGPGARRNATRPAGSSPPPTSASCLWASTPTFPPTRPGTAVDDLPQTAFDHGEIVLSGRERLRGKLSYTNVGFALAPATFTLGELREIYVAALGHEVSATNLKRVLLRRGALTPTGEHRAPGRAGGRPAEVFRFRDRRLAVTDPFAALAPAV